MILTFFLLVYVWIAFCVSKRPVFPQFIYFFNFLLRPVFLFDFVYQCTVHTSKISGGQCAPVDPMHCSWDLQTFFLFFFRKFFIKNRSHGTIHTFKNDFATIFSVFSKISGIQTNLQQLQYGVNVYTLTHKYDIKQSYIYIHTF